MNTFGELSFSPREPTVLIFESYEEHKGVKSYFCCWHQRKHHPTWQIDVIWLPVFSYPKVECWNVVPADFLLCTDCAQHSGTLGCIVLLDAEVAVACL